MRERCLTRRGILLATVGAAIARPQNDAKLLSLTDYETAARDKIVAAFCQGPFSPHSGSPWNIPIKGHVIPLPRSNH